MVLMYKWEAGEALRLIEQERCTGMSGVPTMAREVLNHPDFQTRDLSSLLTLGGGGARCRRTWWARSTPRWPTRDPTPATA
jgi:long-chain acyl-CoA synthetase